MTIEEDVNALSEKFRSLNLNTGVLRFEQNYFKCDGSLFLYVMGDLMLVSLMFLVWDFVS